MSWRDLAACKDVEEDIFFPDLGGSSNANRARAVCQRCPVRQECLDYAVRHNITHGVWGGCTWPQRRAYRDTGVVPLPRPRVGTGMRVPGEPVPGIKHGTRWSYEHHGCKCEECRAVQVRKKRAS